MKHQWDANPQCYYKVANSYYLFGFISIWWYVAHASWYVTSASWYIARGGRLLSS